MTKLIISAQWHNMNPDMKRAVSFRDVFPNFKPPDLSDWKEPLYGHLGQKQHQAAIIGLAQQCHGPIVEFGTFTGRTTRLLAQCTPHEIYTIDIGNDPEDHYPDYVPGSDFIGTPEADRIHLIIGDSRDVGIPLPFKSAGFIFIDGGHTYDVVLSDSRRAMDLVSDQGIIAWDDYNPSWPDSERAVNEINKIFPCVYCDKEYTAIGGMPVLRYLLRNHK